MKKLHFILITILLLSNICFSESSLIQEYQQIMSNGGISWEAKDNMDKFNLLVEKAILKKDDSFFLQIKSDVQPFNPNEKPKFGIEMLYSALDFAIDDLADNNKLKVEHIEFINKYFTKDNSLAFLFGYTPSTLDMISENKLKIVDQYFKKIDFYYLYYTDTSFLYDIVMDIFDDMSIILISQGSFSDHYYGIIRLLRYLINSVNGVKYFSVIGYIRSMGFMSISDALYLLYKNINNKKIEKEMLEILELAITKGALPIKYDNEIEELGLKSALEKCNNLLYKDM